MLFRLRTPLNEMSDAELMVLWQQLSKIGGRYRRILNWKFSAWLMNIPIEHIACGLSVTQSMKE
jgi:hypothetical protein